MQKISYFEPELTHEISYHTHHYAQISLQTKGDFYLTILGKEYVITCDNMGFVPPDCVHGFRCEEKNKTILFNIPADMISKNDVEILQENPILTISAQLRPIIELIKQELKENSESRSVDHLFYYVYNKFLEQCQIKSIRYINANFFEQLSLQKLSEIENYNPTYYCEWFKRKTGFSPSQFVQNTRIEHAKMLLINTNMNIVTIATTVGYTNNSAFARAFGSLSGVSPKVYREKNSKKL